MTMMTLERRIERKTAEPEQKAGSEEVKPSMVKRLIDFGSVSTHCTQKKKASAAPEKTIEGLS